MTAGRAVERLSRPRGKTSLLEPFGLLLLGGPLNTSEEVVNKNFDVS